MACAASQHAPDWLTYACIELTIFQTTHMPFGAPKAFTPDTSEGHAAASQIEKREKLLTFSAVLPGVDQSLGNKVMAVEPRNVERPAMQLKLQDANTRWR